MWAAVLYLPFAVKYLLMICVLAAPFSECGTVNISGHPTPLKPESQVPISNKLEAHPQPSKPVKSSKRKHHHHHHQASKSTKSAHRHPAPKVSKLEHRPKVSTLNKSRKPPVVAVYPPKSSSVWARQKAAYSGHPSHNVVYSGKPSHHVPYSGQAKKNNIRHRYPLRAPVPRAAPRPIPLRRNTINPLQRLFGQHERAQRHPTRLIQGPPAKLRHPQRVPVPNFVYLPAEQLPGYETFKLHEVIRKQEGTQIFDGRKPDVIHYVDSPEIQTTQKPTEEKEVKKVKKDTKEVKEKAIVKKEIKKEDQISELIDERSAKKPKEFELR